MANLDLIKLINFCKIKLKHAKLKLKILIKYNKKIMLSKDILYTELRGCKRLYALFGTSRFWNYLYLSTLKWKN